MIFEQVSAMSGDQEPTGPGVLSEPIENLIQDQPSGPEPVTIKVKENGEEKAWPVHVLIVGSGYGGAIAAMRLAGENQHVVVFERGKEHGPGAFPESLEELPSHVQFRGPDQDRPTGYSAALFDFRIGSPVSVLVGCGLGGTSLINANVALRPEDDLFHHPDWPSALRNRAILDPSFTEVERLLGVRTQGGVTTYGGTQKYEALKRLADGLKGPCQLAPIAVTRSSSPGHGKSPYEKVPNAVGISQHACVGCGNCVTGCNVGAKNTLPMNAIPLATSRGARFYTGATVLSVEPDGAPDGSGEWNVRFRRTDTAKTVLRAEVFTLRAQVVILAAGTLGSTEILLRSQARRKGTLKFSEHLGRRFSTNGDALAFGYGQRREVNAVAHADLVQPDRPSSERGIGPTITGYVTIKDGAAPQDDGHRRAVTIEDGAIPSALAQVFGEIVVTASTARRNVKDGLPAWFHDNAGQKPDPLAVHPDALRRTQILLAMGDDGAQGRLELQPEHDGDCNDLDCATIRIAAPCTSWKRDRSGGSVFDDVDRLLEGGERKGGFDGGEYLPNPFWKLFSGELSRASMAPAPGGNLLSVHPLGGCPMGNDVESGVVDHFGQVFRRDGPHKDSRYDGLYVMDGAILPCAIGVNPFLTIAALAYRNAEAVGTYLGWPVQGIGKVTSQPDGAAIRDAMEKALPGKDPDPLPKHEIEACFVEWMTGHLSVCQVPRWLEECVPQSKRQSLKMLNQDHRLVIKVEIRISNIFEWLRNPDAGLPASVWLYANKGSTDPLRDEELGEADLVELATSKEEDKNKETNTVTLLARDGPKPGLQKTLRALCACLTFLVRRGLDFGALSSTGTGWWKMISIFWRVAKNHANRRELRYNFKLGTDSGEVSLTGAKQMAYALGKKDPWTAWLDLPIELRHGADSVKGLLHVDLLRITRKAPFQARTPNTPVTVAAMASAGMMMLRVLFQTHFWSFRAPNYPKTEMRGNHDPGPIRLGDGREIEPEFIPLPVPESADDPTKTVCLRLVRYRSKGSAPGNSILLVHGLAHSSLVFATDTVGVNMATYLCGQGYDVWLLDHRLSIALPGRGPERRLAANQWTMDQIADYDIHEAVKCVYDRTGGPIQVFAHCIGAGSTAMAILSGRCQDARSGQPMIKALALHAVHPWVIASVANHVKANLAAFFRDAITWKTLDAVLPDQGRVEASDVLMDRIAGSIPWASWWERVLHRFGTDKQRLGRDLCNRMTLFYGYEWIHGNLACGTHASLIDLVGVGNMETFRQIYFLLARRRLTTRMGENKYVTAENFDRYWRFPTLFAHGADNQVYSPVSAVRSGRRLQELRKEAWAEKGSRAGVPGPPDYGVFWREVPDCGHMDFLFGKNAAVDVYPYLDAFFRRARNQDMPRRVKAASNILDEKRPEKGRDTTWDETRGQPTCGPIIGWARRDGGKVVLRLWVEPLLYSAIEVCDKPPEDPPAGITIRRVDWPDGQDYPGLYWVYDLVIPPTFDQDLRISVVRQPAASNSPAQFRLGVEAVSSPQRQTRKLHDPKEGVGIPLKGTPWFDRLKAAAAKQREAPDGAPAGGAFLVGSCRYPGSPFDEELADEVFESMLQHVGDGQDAGGGKRRGIDHVLLVGDQIYADATADVFDTRELRERFAGQYREAFGAPNMRRLLASVPTYMALDDHEIDDNWQGDHPDLPAGDPLVEKSRNHLRYGRAAAMAYQWSMSSRHEGPHDPRKVRLAIATDGLWYTFESGGLPFFVMDTRTERDLRRAGLENRDARLVSDGQLAVLKQWLQEAPRDKPKFIVSGSVLAPVSRWFGKDQWLYRCNDGWAGYPATWRDMVQHIVENQIEKVVFIAGDYHFSALAKLTLSSDGLWKTKGKGPVAAYQIVASGLFVPLPFANAKKEAYDWGTVTPLPWSGPDPERWGQSDAALTVEPYLLCTQSRHFLRIDVTGGASWSADVGVYDCNGLIAPEMAVGGPFKTKGKVVHWNL